MERWDGKEGTVEFVRRNGRSVIEVSLNNQTSNVRFCSSNDLDIKITIAVLNDDEKR